MPRTLPPQSQVVTNIETRTQAMRIKKDENKENMRTEEYKNPADSDDMLELESKLSAIDTSDDDDSKAHPKRKRQRIEMLKENETVR